MLIPFSKMQAQGNDFVILNLLGQKDCKHPLPELAEAICEPAFGVGADGLVVLHDDPEAAARMIIINADGSRAAMCGSALRCCASLLYDLNGRSEVSIATDSGIKTAVISATPEGRSIVVNLGTPVLLEEDVQIGDVKGSLVDVGNLHFVSLWDDLEDQHLRFGGMLEKHPHFSRGVNSEYIQILSPEEIVMTVWEHGVGPTFACGTGATASVFTGIHKGLLGSSVKVGMPGGEVRITRLDNAEFTLAGSVEYVFNGVYRWKI